MARPKDRVLADSFRFDAEAHEYISLVDGQVLPHITGMLERTGWIDDTWMTEESSERGRCVHALTAEYDLAGLELETCVSRYRGYLLAHAAAMRALRPTWTAIEEPVVHPLLRFGGRPDRVGRVQQLQTVLEVKSGVEAPSHAIQTALQAILVSAYAPLPAAQWRRLALYLKANGKYKLIEHRDRRDFDEAHRIIRVCVAA